MAPLSPSQLRWRDRIESAIGLAAPALDLILAAGERVSRIVSPGDDYIPIRPPSEAFGVEARAEPRARGRELTD